MNILCCIYHIYSKFWDTKTTYYSSPKIWKSSLSYLLMCVPYSIQLPHITLYWLCWRLRTHQPKWVILCRLPEKGRREIVEETKVGQGRKRKIHESEETDEIKTFPFYPHLLQEQQTLSNCKPISVGHPGDAKYRTPLPHPTTPHNPISAQSS